LFAGHAARADFTFGEPTNLGPTVNTSDRDAAPSISADGLSLYLASDRPGGSGGWDLWVSTRKSTIDPWGKPVNLGPAVNSASDDSTPSITADGLLLYYASERSGNMDLWVSRRETLTEPWGPPVSLGATVNSPSLDGFPSISTDELSLYFFSNRPGGYGGDELWVTHRVSINDSWQTPVNLGSTVNSPNLDASPSISADSLMLFFQSGRPGSMGYDLWVTSRTAITDDWRVPVNPGPPLNSSSTDLNPSISADGSMLYFNSWRSGGSDLGDLWQASIEPVVDFNSDYEVDIDDLIMLIEHWGQNEPAYDMGPMPWGDGVIDRADLEVLMSHWGQEVYDPHFLAHWALDELEGDIAYDSAGENDALVLGDVVWHSDGGAIQGALALSGDSEYLSTPLALNPSDTVFSVFVWIKSGLPGQVILSQENGVNWLMADVGTGNLRTEVSDPIVSSRTGTTGGLPLIGPAVITEDKWQRVGLVWDGQNRILYVDDVEVARDTVNDLARAHGALYIGTGSGLEPGTFWSGLIDDVRIYDRVVIP